MIKLAIKCRILFIYIINFIKLLKYTLILHRNNVFRDGNPVLLLVVVQEYLKIEFSNFAESIVNNRNIKGSFELFSKLVDTYLKTESPVILQQLLEVLKVEFIERKNNVH